MEAKKFLNPENLHFRSDASTVALEHCKANLLVPQATPYLESLWADYERDGKPADRSAWLRPRLEAWFPSSGERPKWVGKRPTPQWPWFEGRPMTFVGQMEGEQVTLPTGQVVHSRVMFIFCAAGRPLVQTEKGWTVVYTVVDQDPNFPW